MEQEPETVEALRREQVIREVQAKIARELAAMSEVSKTCCSASPISCANFIGGRRNAPCHTASMFQR